MKAIIPCAGYGKRMNMLPNQSKEMLEDKIYGYNHIVDFSLEFCRLNNLEPLIITRSDKKDLIDYLKEKEIEYILYEPKENDEWYDSVLASIDFWKEKNLLILPDTRWNEKFIAKDIETMLELGNEMVIGIHKVKDPEKWGIVNNYEILEKPKDLNGEQYAWGLIGFNKFEGKLFLECMKDKYFLLSNTGFVKLTGFQDITRGRK